ncbi:MAG: class I SAM-dependent methyltransferase [Leptolyngbyaceae cyanobacterium SL_5_9]|nr:class I SAM-dependent methyltransferase [Leptolyngbyaceae cyanobacterium SL_5_9]NJO74269.1 class I SAM-dependent methyltransferase [Leptolyngbyaceae cyanobacterium RM1_406_9]
MIEVLQSWLDIGKATLSLQRQGLPTHITVQKNWDQFLLAQELLHTPNSSAILDLGCGDCCTLKFLAALGFSDLSGIDLHLPQASSTLPYKLAQGDLMNTSFTEQSFDGAVSISVIEHGVDLKAFFHEAHRILKPGGMLFVTTDYWKDKVEIASSIRPFGLSWQIFSKAEIEEAIAIAQTCGFELKQNTAIPPCKDKTVTWYDKDYTFIALTFRKLTS